MNYNYCKAEKVFGSAKFLMIYLFSGLLANTGTYLAGTAPYSLGASGSTFGLIGALAAYYYTNRNILGNVLSYICIYIYILYI